MSTTTPIVSAARMLGEVDDSTVVVAAPDVDSEFLDGRRWRVTTAVRSVEVRLDEERFRAVRRVVRDILPRLDRALPLREQLGPADSDRLAPLLESLGSIGVLLFPTPAAATQIVDADTLGLYCYLARRSDEADVHFVQIRSRRIDVVGPPALVGAWSSSLRRQGLLVGADRAWDGSGEAPRPADAALAVVAVLSRDASGADADQSLSSLNERWCRAGQRWVPVVVTPKTTRIGPWTAPGQAACLGCALAFRGDRDAARRVPPPGRSRGARPIAWSTATAWSTCQPGPVAWAGGLLTHQLLRAFVPIAEHHPWGSETTLDTERLAQHTVRLWRDPHCLHCGTPRGRSQAWREA